MGDLQHRMTYAEVERASLADWRLLYGAIEARFRTGDFASGLALVARIGAAAEAAGHHPEVVLTYPHVDVTLSSHDAGGVTLRDVDLARRISEHAAELGAAPAPEEVARLEVALDVPEPKGARAFWAAALGYTTSDRDDEVVDPGRTLPTVWLQKAPGATGEVPQRFHLDVRVAREVAEARVEAAIAAGGTLVSDAAAPAYWVLADAHGNKVCVCTADGRE